MALDHKNARSSAINPSLPFRMRLPFPNSDISAQDRAHADYMYILASGSSTAPAAAGSFKVIRRVRRRM